MFYYFSQYLLKVSENTAWHEELSFLRLFRYISFRGAGALITALALSLWLGPKVIAWLKRLKFGQDYVDKAEEAGGLGTRTHSKRGTPTMGGILIIAVMDVTALLWAQWSTHVVLTLISVLVLAGLGFYDDYAKITQQSNKGAAANIKLWVQCALGIFIAFYLWRDPSTEKLISEVMVPFVKYPVATGTVGVVIGLILASAAIVGSSNAVNLTDGLDGLAIGCTLIVSTVFAAMTYLAGNFRTASYLQMPYVAGSGELTIICLAMIGAGLGFLWFNCHPAQVFMGDTGSLALGGLLGTIAVAVKHEIVLGIVGGLFVLEALSVIVQVASFKLTGKRVFRMAPFHHHLEKMGWKEPQIVIRLWIFSFVLAMIGLATLKVR